MKHNVLHITPDFNYACGRSYYVFLLLKYLKRNNHNVLLVTNGGDSLERLDEEGIPYAVIKSIHSKNPVAFANALKRLRTITTDKNIDIIHSHHRYSEFLALQLASIRRRKIHTVFTSLSFVDKRYRIEYRSDRIIAVSNSIKKMLIQNFGVKEKKIEVIHNFTDTNEIHELEILSEHPKDHGNNFNILSIGRFHHEKNFNILLEALALINDNSIKTIILGEGEQYHDYKIFIQRRNLNVELALPQKNLLEYFLIADLCVLPSRRDPFPNFMLQSGLHKKPFIGTNVDGIGELIEHGRNGLLFDLDNATELAENIVRMKSDLVLRRLMAEQLYHDVINNYTQEFILPKIEKVYNSLY